LHYALLNANSDLPGILVFVFISNITFNIKKHFENKTSSMFNVNV